MNKSEVKIKYTPEELEKLKERAKKSKKSLSEYQREISKKAEVKIELRDGI